MTHALSQEEYVEQGYLFQLLNERLEEDLPMQELLQQVSYELLTTTKLPMAVDYLLTELKHSGLMSPAMVRMPHYFTAFQSYLVAEAESETGRFTMNGALSIMEAEAKYRTKGAKPQGLFFFQFESLCRNRLNYDKGFTAISSDPMYSKAWAKWILMLRNQLGLIDMADLLFLASDEYRQMLIDSGEPAEAKGPFLFGRREGRIAIGNRKKEPLFLFAAMQRHLGYPTVPRPKPIDEDSDLIPQMARRIERLEMRIKIMEEERRGGLDITKFYEKNKGNAPQLPDD